jgi:hypothetical protein
MFYFSGPTSKKLVPPPPLFFFLHINSSILSLVFFNFYPKLIIKVWFNFDKIQGEDHFDLTILILNNCYACMYTTLDTCMHVLVTAFQNFEG